MKIIIAGAGEVGSHLAKMLSNESNDLTIIDTKESNLNNLSQIADVVTVLGNPTSISLNPSFTKRLNISTFSSTTIGSISA